MKEFIIKLETIANVQDFVKAITGLDSDFDICSGRYVVDAKSILGIFGLDLKNELVLKVYDCTDEVKAAIKPFIVGEK